MDYFRIKQELDEVGDEEEETPYMGRMSINELAKGKLIKLDASLTDWTNTFIKARKTVRKNANTQSTHQKLQKIIVLPRVYDHLNNSLSKIDKSAEAIFHRRTQSQNCMTMSKHKARAEIRKVNILGGILPQEQKTKQYDSVPKMLKRIKVLRSKSRRQRQLDNMTNPGEFSLFSLNEKIKCLYKSPPRGHIYYESFVVEKSNLLDYNI